MRPTRRPHPRTLRALTLGDVTSRDQGANRSATVLLPQYGVRSIQLSE